MSPRIDPDKIEYRTMNEDEFDQVAHVFSVAFKTKVDGASFKSRFKNCAEPVLERQFVAVHDGKIVAGIRADYKPLYFVENPGEEASRHDCGEINDVSTLPRYRRLGIARRLLTMAIDYMLEQGWELAALQANPAYHAKDLYKSMGFETLKGTGDIWHVKFGTVRTMLSFMGGLALLVPLAKLLGPLVVPHPPRECMDLLTREELTRANQATRQLEKTAGGEGKGRNDSVAMVHVTGEIMPEDPWVTGWNAGMKSELGPYQGLHDEFLRKIFVHDTITPGKDDGEKLKEYRNNRRLKKFFDNGGRVENHVLFLDRKFTDIHDSTRPRRKGQMVFVDSRSIPITHLIGGIKYHLENFEAKGLSIFIASIDGVWTQHSGNDVELTRDILLKKKMLEMLSSSLKNTFPIFLRRVSSGNIRERITSHQARFYPIGGSITMVKPLNNHDLFNKLKNAVEPWVLV